MSATRAPRELTLYPMALMMSNLWCFGILCFGRIAVGLMVGWFIFALSLGSPFLWLLWIVMCDLLVWWMFLCAFVL